jgi:Conserved TM helix
MFTDFWRSAALFLPKALAFVAILIVGWLVARGLKALTGHVLERLGFDRLAERGGIRAALARGRYDASDIVARLVYYAVLLFTLQLAFGIWGPNPVSDLIGGIVAWLPKALVAVLIVVVAAAIAAAVKDVIATVLGGLSYGRFLANAVSVFIIGIGVIAALNQVGIATTVTMPILITLLATIGGILIVGVGGGLIRPMQARWEGWLSKAGEESGRVAGTVRAYAAERAAARAAPDPDPAPVAAAVPAPTTWNEPTQPHYARGRVEVPAVPAPTESLHVESRPVESRPVDPPAASAPETPAASPEKTQKLVRSDPPHPSD